QQRSGGHRSPAAPGKVPAPMLLQLASFQEDYMSRAGSWQPPKVVYY
ncbi:RIKEN cDNA 4930432O21, isoform CRA_a, partial [Mus musculus]